MVALAVVATPSAAGAATASLSYEEPVPGLAGDPAYSLVVQAEGGEQNRIHVSGDDAGYTVRDDGAPLTAGLGCEPVDMQEARCAATVTTPQRSVLVDGRDRDDEVEIGSLPAVEFLPGPSTVEVRGGPGSDLLVGGSAHELFLGGSGADRVAAGDGFDRLDGGGGDDALDGGAGQDRLSYQARRDPVHVDLGAGTGGAAGERDELTAIEDVVGGKGRDRVAGDRGPNTLVGGEGDARDVLVGRGGDDTLTGYRLSGGPGSDSLDGHSVSCGRGRDMVYRGVFRTRGPYPADCETAQAVFVVLTARPISQSRRHADFGVACRASTCRGKLELRDDEGRLGIVRFSLQRGDQPDALRPVRVPLTRRGTARVVTLRVSGVSAFHRDHLLIRLR